MQIAVLREALEALQRTAASAQKPMWNDRPRGDELVRAGLAIHLHGEPTSIMASALCNKADEARGAL